MARPPLDPSELRYEKAHEFIEVCQQLWNSWYEDEVVMDRENGVFADASKVHRIEHQGRFYSSRRPLNIGFLLASQDWIG